MKQKHPLSFAYALTAISVFALAVIAGQVFLAGCGAKSGPHGTSQASARRAQEKADEAQMALLAMGGYEIPADGGPMVLFGTDECVPGEKHGPCLDERCVHKLCGKCRVLAARKCPLCGQPVGMGRGLRIATQYGSVAPLVRPVEIDKNGATLLHGKCFDIASRADCPKCLWPMVGQVKFRDGKLVHDKIQCDEKIAWNSSPSLTPEKIEEMKQEWREIGDE